MKRSYWKLLVLLVVLALCVSACGGKRKAPGLPQVKSIKILAIGNSFSVDAMEHLYGILKDVGYEEIVLGNLCIGGCDLSTHVSNFQSNKSSYTYCLNTTGKWQTYKGHKPLDALDSESWDVITLQQASRSSGVPKSYNPCLSSLVVLLRTHCPGARLAWHMTWAYQANATNSVFGVYKNNQMAMYNAISDAVQTAVMPTGYFSRLIPCGTAIQNMRTSFVGDHLTRDGYHLSFDKGRYVAALTYAKALTNCDLTHVSYMPSGSTFTKSEMSAMKEAASNACRKPYSVTPSIYSPDLF